jgi:hypothetical protein
MPPTTAVKWDKILEEQIANIGNNCRSYKIIYNIAAEKLDKDYNMLMNISIILGPLITAISSLSSVFIDYVYISLIFISLIGLLNGISVAKVKFSNYKTKIILYKTHSSRFFSLENNIRKTCAFPRTSRTDASKYYDWLTTSYEELYETKPLISDSVLDQYMIYANKNSLNVPDEYGKTPILNGKRLSKVLITHGSCNIQINDNSIDESSDSSLKYNNNTPSHSSPSPILKGVHTEHTPQINTSTKTEPLHTRHVNIPQINTSTKTEPLHTRRLSPSSSNSGLVSFELNIVDKDEGITSSRMTIPTLPRMTSRCSPTGPVIITNSMITYEMERMNGNV